jgi:hypothetical protein
MAESWKVAGTYFESCNCYAPCSCVCLSPPSDGDCAVLIGWHVDQGEFADVTLDGLNIALHEPSRSRWVFKLVRNAGEWHQLAPQLPG